MSGVDELLVAEVEARVQMPTDAEVAAFYPVVERRLEGVSLEVAAPYLRMELLQRAQAERYAVFIEELRSKAGVELAIPYPDLPRADIPIEDHDPVLGPADAAVTIVQFAEYQCYFCQKVQPTVDQLMEAYPGEVRMVLKDFPLSGHGRAIPAAVAAHCAGEQGNYWQMYDVLLSNQQALGDADLVRYGQELGIDEQRYRACLTDGRHEASIYDDMAVARQLGVQATPTFFINGVVFPGAQPYERFASLIDRELGR